MIYRGGCHCGDVAIEVEGDISMVVSCNCSICQRRGSMLWRTPHAGLKVTAEPGALADYRFGAENFANRFCQRCGIHVFHEDASADGERFAYVNVRALEDFDLQAVEVFEYDGRAA